MTYIRTKTGTVSHIFFGGWKASRGDEMFLYAYCREESYLPDEIITEDVATLPVCARCRAEFLRAELAEDER